MKISYGILLTVFSIIIISEMTGMYFLYDFKNTLEDNIAKNSEHLNSIMVNRIDSYTTERLVDAINFANDATIKTAVEMSNKQFSNMPDPVQYIDKMDAEWKLAPQHEITPFMRTLIDSQTSEQLREISNTENTLFNGRVYGEIFVTNSYGATVAETDKTSDYKQNDETWWQEAKKNGIYLGEVEFDNSSGTQSFPVAKRIDDTNGNFLGVVKGVVNIGQVINIIKTQMSSETTKPVEYELIQSDGTVLYSTDPNEKTFVKHYEREYINKINDFSGYFTYEDPDSGEKYLVTYSHSKSEKISPIFNWIFIAKFKTADLLEPVNRISNYMLTIMVILISTISTAVFIISSRLARPIERLQQGMTECTNGKFLQIKPEGMDELRDLSEQFNETIKKIDESQITISKSEKKYRTLFELSPAIICLTDEKLNIVSVNKKFLDMFGYTVDEIIGKHAFVVGSEKSRDKFERIADGKEDEQHNEDIWLKKKNGDEFPAIVNAKRIYDENNRFQGLIGMMLDRTKLYESQKIVEQDQIKLQESNNIYEGLFELNPEPIRISGLDLITTNVNQSFLRKFGYSREEIIGKSIYTIVEEESRNAIDAVLEDLRKGKRVESREIVYRKKDNTKIPISLSVSLSRDQIGNPTGYIAVMTDISEIYNAKKTIQEDEENILNQLMKLRQIDELKDQFSSMISHELTTPLFPIKFHAEMLKDSKVLGKLNKEQINSVNEIYNNSIRLERLIEDVLDAQKLERGVMKFNKKDFEINEFTKKIEKDSMPIMTEKSIKLENSTKEKIIINSDPDRLEQVFSNLIKNSVDFVSEKTGKIEIGSKVQEKDILFYVKDNGIGIPKEKQDILFKKFYQIDTSLRRKHYGSGLGLSICKGIVEGLGGKIWLESTEGLGTIIYFTIPKGDTT